MKNREREGAKIMKGIIKDSLGYELEVKLIKRGNELYYNSGIWADGHLAYSKITKEKGKLIVKEEDECTFVQIRENKQLVMVRI